MSRAVQEGCIASCVRCSLLPDLTHKSYLLRSTAISVSVPCYMWIMFVVDSCISTSSMVCQILWLIFCLGWQWYYLCGISCSLLSHALHRITLGGKSAGFSLSKKQFLDFSLLSAGFWPYIIVSLIGFLFGLFHSSTYISPDVGWRNSGQKVQVFYIGWLQATCDGVFSHRIA